MTGGTEGGGGKISSGHNTRWGREEVESMLSQRRWTDTDGTGVRAQLLAQKQIHQLESQAMTDVCKQELAPSAGASRRYLGGVAAALAELTSLSTARRDAGVVRARAADRGDVATRSTSTASR